jgi:capsular exopolysaccharide synthesis family protein
MTTTDFSVGRSADNPFLALPGAGPSAAAQPGAISTYSPHHAAHKQDLSAGKRLHALLRGRYWLAAILCTIGAITGAVVGFKSQKPYYTASGIVELKLVVSSINRDDRTMLMASQFMGNQITMMQGDRVIMGALSEPEWLKTGKGASPDVQADFRDHLDIDLVPGTSYLRVSYKDTDPRVAAAAVTSVINSYKIRYGEMNNQDVKAKLRLLSEAQREKTSQIDADKTQILLYAREYGSANLDAYHNAKLQQLVEIESELASARASLDALNKSVGTADTANPPPSASNPALNAPNPATAAPAPGFAPAPAPFTSLAELNPDEIATVDPTVRELLRSVRDSEFQLKRLQGRFPGQNRTVVDAQRDLDLLRTQLDDACRSFRARYVTIRTDPVTNQTLPVSSETFKQLRDRVTYLQARYDKVKDETTRIGEKKLSIQEKNNEIDRLKGELELINRSIENLTSEIAMSGELNVVEPGSVPTSPSQDKRKQMAILGFGGGALLPLGLLLLIGLIDFRFRFSDDAGQHMPHVQLLGILPHLPNLGTDPQQATVAAHCVHQIRTMLEISADTQGRRSFAVTSPSPTDGKTSLSLALGLSFAAAGTRTLLIDCDVIGGGLSARMNQTHPTGTLEAVASKQLAPFVRSTDVANLSILPVGVSSALHPTILSPSALGRLITDAKANYDIVLVDTGPVLGSVEASPACAACDAVVLVVSRGRQKTQVNRALDHLVSIGARLAGVVFNRASTPDFERSMSRLSLRQEPTTTTEA